MIFWRQGCSRRLAVSLLLSLWGSITGFAQESIRDARPENEERPNVASVPDQDVDTSLLGSEIKLIDLASALNLAGVRNPQLLVARERVLEAVALRQFAAAQFLPSLHMGTGFDNHN